MYVLLILQIREFKDYVNLYIKDKTDEAGGALKMVHEIVNPRWEVAVTLSNNGFQQVSFVNSIATTKVIFPPPPCFHFVAVVHKCHNNVVNLFM